MKNYNPKANENAVIVSNDVRFTVLTSGLVRMEWSEDGIFEDNASLVFLNRNLPVPKFEKKTDGNSLIIKTEKLTLKYKINSGKFNADNLSVEFDFNGKKVSWNINCKNSGNLKGTARTLDQYDGEFERQTKEKLELDEGLISKDGWTLIDDTGRPLFDDSDWPWVTQRPDKNHQDLYFFCYGYDYKTALSDFTKVAGKIALPPRFAFGIWWSRYWEYTDMELRELVADFEFYNLPLDVFVVDMDWHITVKPEWFDENGNIKKDQAGQPAGWTGFTWNKNYFPDPKRFLKWLKEKKMEVCLNLHPASGIQPHEEQYEAMAKAMGIDPSTGKYVPFDIVDKKFAKNFMEIVLHPMEEDGVDFWWLDWQQWSTTKIPGVNPTFYLNYVFFSDMERRNKKRPIIFHRYGGLGNHRYQIGFSGDTLATWESLNFQPYFTATAANVGFGYWSHDIGGHFFGSWNPELYTRWVQFGVFSPIFRTHSSPDTNLERKIWEYPTENFKIMHSAFHLRRALQPYIYTAARNTYDTGISICKPLYYEYPEKQEAYDFKNQYFFGNDLMVSPVTEPIPEGQLYVEKEIWLPEGNWYEMFSGTLLNGGKIVKRKFTLDEIPVYVKAGTIIPMLSEDGNPDTIVLNVFRGAKGATVIYDDEGNNQNFKSKKYTFTKINYDGEKVVINPVEGSFPGMPEKRKFVLKFHLTLPPVKIKINGQVSENWDYDGNEFSAKIYIPEFDIKQKIEIEVIFPEFDIEKLSGKQKQLNSLIKFMKFLAANNWNKSRYSNDLIVWFAQTGHRITLNPETAKKEIEEFDENWNKIVEMINRASEENEKYKPYVELMK